MAVAAPQSAVGRGASCSPGPAGGRAIVACACSICAAPRASFAAAAGRSERQDESSPPIPVAPPAGMRPALGAMMGPVVGIVIPVFALVLCGWAFARWDLLPPGGARGIGVFVFNLAIPAQIGRAHV